MVGCISGKAAVLAQGGNQTLANNLNASYFEPPYAVNNGDNRYNISYKTVAITAMHYDGTLEYNAHNLYGMYETLATADALQKLRNKRQFILTRCASGSQPVPSLCAPTSHRTPHPSGCPAGCAVRLLSRPKPRSQTLVQWWISQALRSMGEACSRCIDPCCDCAEA